MSNVTKFPDRGPGPSDVAFMQCPCSEDAWFMPVVIADPNRPLIIGIQCPECDTWHDVVNGIIRYRNE